MKGNNKKKNKNYYKYHKNHNNNNHNNHNNHNNKKIYYYKNKNKKKQNIVVDNKQDNQNVDIILDNNVLDNKQELQTEEQRFQQQIHQVFKENSVDYDELEFMPVKKRQRTDFSDKQEVDLSNKFGFVKYALGFVILVAIVFGVSYSFFTYRKEDTRQGDIASGEVYVTLQEQTATLTLNKMYPRTAEEARARNDNYIDFTIKAKNTSETKEIKYSLNIVNGEDVQNKTRINPQYLLIDLEEKVNNSYTYVKNAVPLNTFSFSDIVPVNTTSEITKEYRLRVWVSDSIIISDTETGASYTQAQFANLYANLNVEINSNDQAYVPLASDMIGAIQTLETTPYGKVYSGATVNNYVWFNNEQWRILGVYNDAVTGEENLKIIKATPSTTSQIWQDSKDYEIYSWGESTMQQTYLNGNYTTIISDPTSRAMIEENATWYVGAIDPDVAAAVAYEDYASNLTWIGKMGLIASYEYLYAAENDGTCWSTIGNEYNYGDEVCYQKDWLYNTITNNGPFDAWTLSLAGNIITNALYVSSSGYIDDYDFESTYAASPVVYLKSNVTITGGNGQIGEANSYKLGLN